MRKLIPLIVATLLLAASTQAQFTNLLNFDTVSGQSPFGNLTLSGNKLYGMTSTGGANNDGVIFMVDTNGGNYKDIYDFNGGFGSRPFGTLLLVGNKFYGMAEMGGGNGVGCIFSIDTNGGSYTDLFDFNGGNGSYPTSTGPLTLAGSKLYGMTSQGGAKDSGCIFSIDTTGKGYKVLFSFNGANGKSPAGSLMIAGNKLFGATTSGCTKENGCVFSIDTNGNGYKTLVVFNDTNGHGPNGSLTLSGKVLYGMTSNGGYSENGCIFSIDTMGTNYKVLYKFDSTYNPHRWSPNGSLILNGSILYGMTESGGPHNNGCIFSIDTNGSGYMDMFDFNWGTGTGVHPSSSLILSGNVLYGMTNEGGASFDGDIFSFKDITTGINEFYMTARTIDIYPNPNNGKFSINIPNIKNKAMMDIYGTLGEKVYSYSLVPGISQINLSSVPVGLYMYRVVTIEGQQISSGKVIIQ
ncbi:MAG TPA: T9SS type A sorting domain-containing protein [Bacteroidia bacterium]|jgi:uncharacterized repeat protein (TIGR03803 family)|nr:T9SS type A sorting domain-containing protein [Bacteroidia bacterium]